MLWRGGLWQQGVPPFTGQTFIHLGERAAQFATIDCAIVSVLLLCTTTGAKEIGHCMQSNYPMHTTHVQEGKNEGERGRSVTSVTSVNEC